VQIACTYAPRKAYRFAPRGSLTPLYAARRAFSKAERYIYIEDQYAVPYAGLDAIGASGDSLGVLTDLRDALRRVDYLILVLPNHTDPGLQSRFRRKQFIAALRAVDPKKVHVFWLGKSAKLQPGPGEVATTGGGSAASGSPK